jgi:hypothetical protein
VPQRLGRARGLLRRLLAGVSAAHGSRKGRIAITLNRAGRRLTSAHHVIHVLLVLTVRDNTGQISTLAYPIGVRVKG